MSLKTLPLLFINLGGEMMYILDQRLRAQNIPGEKATRVMHDIVSTMFSKRFMEELFKPQELYSKKALRTVFDRLAHASIMRLNSASMDKLYDLMTMAFKYQVSLCLQPKEILLVTLNHMDSIRAFVNDSHNIRQQVENVYRLLIQNYASLSSGDFQLIRQTLLSFFQDMHIRVSIFLKDKVQNANGRFVLPTSGLVPPGTEIPGTIRLFNDNGDVCTVPFSSGGNYVNSSSEGSYDISGDRVTKLGTNMYNVVRQVETMLSGPANTKVVSQISDMEANTPNPLAKAQLDLLSHLIGGGDKRSSRTEFRLNLFSTDEEEENAVSFAASASPTVEEASGVIRINAQMVQNQELNRIMGELAVDDDNSEQKDDDLLDLLDKA
ncbi:protein OSCP1-like [Tubulanus polymorphus]|uniref:protein OSCP1-like n=1 Tax=Tubulanus polymorphus TaxID=672921 RepID=UPI003DA39050